MQISKKGLSILKELEGFKSKPYLDSAGIPTIGYGFTYYLDGRKVKLTDEPMSEEFASEMLEKIFNRDFVRYIPENVNQNQYDALGLFIFNVGKSAFINSTLKRKVLVNPNDPTIEDEFMKWNKATVNGKKVAVKGLTNRRMKEVALYFS